MILSSSLKGTAMKHHRTGLVSTLVTMLLIAMAADSVLAGISLDEINVMRKQVAHHKRRIVMDNDGNEKVRR